MTTQARALALEDRVAAGGVPGLHRARIERVHVADIRHEAREGGCVERSKRGHPGVRKAVGDYGAQLQVILRNPEFSTAKIDVRHASTVVAMAVRTMLAIQPRAVLDISAVEIPRMPLQSWILRLRSPAGPQQADRDTEDGHRP